MANIRVPQMNWFNRKIAFVSALLLGALVPAANAADTNSLPQAYKEALHDLSEMGQAYVESTYPMIKAILIAGAVIVGMFLVWKLFKRLTMKAS